ncbi:MAG: hypothetical protein AAFX44_06550 [Pseudomonadota bacterium]
MADDPRVKRLSQDVKTLADMLAVTLAAVSDRKDFIEFNRDRWSAVHYDEESAALDQIAMLAVADKRDILLVGRQDIMRSSPWYQKHLAEIRAHLGYVKKEVA